MITPAQIGPYAVSEVLGSGGSGTVFRGTHRTNGRDAAVKVPSDDTAKARDALAREVGILTRLARVGAPGVVRILEHGLDGSVPWYAMQLVRGRSLRAFAQTLRGERSPRRGALPEGELERVLWVVFRLAETLAHLHGEGVVHGDVAPGNVVLTEEERPILIDFGAGLVDALDPSGRRTDLVLRGTLGYTAPEIVLGTSPDPRADLYGLGCILHELLAGAPPFAGDRPEDVVRQQLSHRPAALSSPAGVPEPVDRLRQRLLEPDPLRRLLRADDVCRVVGEHLPGHPGLERRELRSTLYRPRLHGREAVLEPLVEALLGLATGGGFVLVQGPSGSGRTALLEELGRRAARGRALVVAGQGARAQRGGPSAGRVPGGGLELFASLVASLVAEFSARSAGPERDALSAELQALSPLVPELVGSTGLVGAPGLSDGTVKRRAFDALEAALLRLAGDSGLVLLLDDLDGADELSLGFLSERAGALVKGRVLVVGACHSEARDVAASAKAVATLELELEPLGTPEIRALSKDVLGAELSPEGLVEFLQSRSAGSPFLVIETLRAVVSRGFLERSEAGEWSFDARAAYAAPVSADELVELRLERLSARARAVLGAISVLSREIQADEVDASTAGPGDARDVLEELVAHDVLAPAPAGGYRFVTESLRTAVEQALDPSERRRHHLRAAGILERASAPQSDGHAAALAHHLAAAAEVARALPYFEQAARAAERGFALERAAELYRLAIDHAGAEHAAVRPRLVEAWVDVLIKQAKHAHARDAARALLAEGIVTDPLARARLRRKVAASLWTLHEYAPATEELDRAERELAEASSPEAAEAHVAELIQIRLGRCQRLYFAGSTGPELDELIQDLGRLLADHGTQDQRCAYAFTAASNALLRGGYAYDAAALTLAQRGLSASLGLPLHRQALAHLLVGGVLMLGTPDERRASLAHFEDAARKAAPDGEATLMARIRIFHAMALLRTGNVEATEAAARVALDAAEAARLPPYVAAAKGCLGWVAWRRDDEKVAGHLLEEALERWKGHAHPFPFRHFVLLPLLSMAEVREDFERARAMLEGLRRGPQRLPPPVAAAVDDALAALTREALRDASRAIRTVLAAARQSALV
jgi:hypothetical protein